MALRISAAGDILYRASTDPGGIPARSGYTLCGWVQFITDPGTGYMYVCGFEDTAYPADSAWWNVLGFNATANWGYSQLAGGLGNVGAGANPAVTEPWFVAMRGDGVTFYTDVWSPTGTRTSSAPGADDYTFGGMCIGSNSYDEWVDAKFQNWKAWDRALTDAELAAERLSYEPLARARLHAWWPMRAGDPRRYMDYSGNGRHLRYAGSVLDEADFAPLGQRLTLPAGLRLEIAFPPAAGGTAYTQTLTGGVTPAGALVKRDNKLASGAVTPAGAVRKQAAKLAAGAVTPAGALRKTAAKLVSGAVTPAGALTRQAGKVLSGAAASSGALVRSVAQRVGGGVTPAGGLSKSVSKPLAGSVAPAGALANVRAVLLTLSGGITPAGALTRQAAKVVSGTMTSAGALTRQAAKVVSGTMTSAGALTRAVSLVRAGVVAPSGAVAKSVSKLLAGAIASIVGALSNVLSGAVSARGQVVVRDEPTARASLDDAAVWETTVSDELAFGAEVRDE